ncbi:flagellar filament capping protein FliD [Leeia oryzae]|uniref:flagellar filament capping protein FliD n=1 Tax=Leeia oryzae TaxID=356662 RepID=UPI0003A65ADA|nr:flagellar filament capping protein FliD [Leeia oryzae]
MGISSSTGLISGIDTNSLVSSLMSVERQPELLLQAKLKSFSTTISALGVITSSVSGIQAAAAALKDSSSLSLSASTSSDTNVATVSSTGSAATGNYSLSVSLLAQANKLITKVANPFASTSVAIANTAGSLHLSSGTNAFDVTLASDSSLEQIRDAINSNNNNTSIVASIINDGTTNRLTLTAKSSGASSGISVTNTSSTGGAGLDVFDTTKSAYDTVQAAQDASFKIDGISFTRSTNTFSDVIDGVTLTLKSADLVTPKTSTLAITKDVAAMTAKVKALVDAYNSFKGNFDTMHSKGGRLEADNTSLTIMNQMRSVFGSSTSISGNNYTYLSQIGITFQKDGSLALDSTVLSKAINDNPSAVQGLFSDASGGFANKIYNTAFDITKSDGLIATRTNSLNKQKVDAQDRIDAMELRLVDVEARYKKQFTAMETALSKITQMTSYISRL